MSPSGPAGDKEKRRTRWPDHTHDLIHTFGVEDYDEYWKAVPMRKGMRPIHKRMHKQILKIVKPPAKLLELGPGPGHLYWALEKSGFEMYACDVSQVSLDALKAPPNRVRLADLNQGLPDFGHRFRVILSALVLHHIFKPDVFLNQLREAIEPKGFLVLTIPNMVTLRNRLRMLAGKFPHLSPSHRNFMTPQEVLALLERSGFRIVSILSARRKVLSALSPELFSKELIVISTLR